jgi:hypothetical protein
MNKLKKRILALGLSIVMTLTMIPMFGSLAFAADEAASTITVYLTVSNKGELAKANDGTIMAWKPVTVTDLDADGTFTFDEALVSAHKAYNKEAGYVRSDSGWVTSLWGDSEASVYSFMDNDKATDVVTVAEIKANDFLVAAVDSDAVYYSDYYAFFQDRFLPAFVGDEITLTVNGFAAMMGGDNEAIAGLAVGYFTSDGTFEKLEKTTDEKGAVTLSFNEPGTYYVTASGVVKGVTAIDWTTYEEVIIEAPIIAPVCVITVAGKYTEKDINFIAADGSQFGVLSWRWNNSSCQR